MTDKAPDRPQRRRSLPAALRVAVALVAAVTVMVVGLAGLFASPASAKSLPRPETRVAASTTPAGQIVGAHPDIPAGQRRARAPDYDRTAVGSCVAAETGEGAGAAVDSVPDPEPVYRPSGAPNRDSPWYVSYRDAEGNLQTVGNEGGVHAEVRIQEMHPGTQMSRPFGWRTVDGSVGPQWVSGTVCAGCQVYPPTLFPPGTGGAPGGPWGIPWAVEP